MYVCSLKSCRTVPSFSFLRGDLNNNEWILVACNSNNNNNFWYYFSAGVICAANIWVEIGVVVRLQNRLNKYIYVIVKLL